MTIVIVTDASTAFGFLIQPFSREINLFLSYWMFDRFFGFVVKDCWERIFILNHGRCYDTIFESLHILYFIARGSVLSDIRLTRSFSIKVR